MLSKEYIFYCAEKNDIITSPCKSKTIAVMGDVDFNKGAEAHEILIGMLTGKIGRRYEYVRIGVV